MTRTVFARVYDAFASIPPMPPGTLLPLIVMLILWTGLRAAGVPENAVFVLVLVVAQAHAVWRSIPSAARHMRDGGRNAVIWPVFAVLVLSTLQLWIADPLFSQRILSGGCIFVLLVMLIGVRREKEVLARVMRTTPSGQPVSLLRVNAVFAVGFLLVNELLIATGSLTVWITAMVVAVFLLHAAYWFIVLLVMPREDGLV
ncbi:MAG: hypothetical protein AAFW87_05015 [Pseudomonadota bacterium]